MAESPTSKLGEDPLGTSSLTFPADIDDISQRHFVKFTIINKSGATFKGAGKRSSTRPDRNSYGDIISEVEGSIAGSSGSRISGDSSSVFDGNLGFVGDTSRNMENSVAAQDETIRISKPRTIPPDGLANFSISSQAGTPDFRDFAAHQGPMSLQEKGEWLESKREADEKLREAVNLGPEKPGGLWIDAHDSFSLAAREAARRGPQLPPGAQTSKIRPQGTDTTRRGAQGGTSKILQKGVDHIRRGAQGGTSKVSSSSKLPEYEEDEIKGIGGGKGTEFSGVKGGTERIVGDIVLYLPIGISETYAPKWAGGEMGLVGAVTDWATEDSVKTAYGEVLKGAGAEIGGNILGGILKNENIKKKMLKAQGLAVNPHWELFFEGVNPRTFAFNFKFAPKSADEAQIAASVIRAFKRYAAPGVATGTHRYWTYPSMFDISYWNETNLHKIASCALTNIQVNYGASGTNHTFHDGFPVQTDLTLTFMESRLMTAGDFTEGAGY